MFCPFCGNENRGGKKFCRQCGKAIPAPRARVMEAGVEAGGREQGAGSGDRRHEFGKRENFAPDYKPKSPAPEPQEPYPDDPTVQLHRNPDRFEVSTLEHPNADDSFSSGNGSERPFTNGSAILPPVALEMPGIPKIFLAEDP